MEETPFEPGEAPLEPAPPAEPTRGRRPRRDRRRRWRALAWAAGGLVLLAAAFFVGLVAGRAIEDAPRPGGTQTLVRTLVPATIGPAEVVTVTVTAP